LKKQNQMKQLSFVFLLLVSSVTTGFAQRSGGKTSPSTPFNFKVNLSALFLRNVSLQGEYAFHKNLSVCLGGRWMFPYSLTTVLGDQGIELQSPQIRRGYAITPELRFYPGKKEKHQAPYGFYLAPYVRYTNFNISALVPLDPDPTAFFPGGNADLSLNYTGWAGGVMMGSQWVINHFTIDWWIMGMHLGQGSIAGTASSPLFGIYPDASAELQDEIQSAMSDLPFDTQTTVSVINNTAEVKVTGLPFGGFRGGLCLGFAF
jgi:hypothetical protein